MGLIAGMGLLVIGVTGSLLVFDEELEEAVRPGMFLAKPVAPPRLSFDRLLGEVAKSLPDYEISSWTFANEPGAVDRGYVVRHGLYERLLVTVNPYTGAVLGGPLDARDTLMGRVMALHYTLFGGPAGILLAGLFAAMLCLLGLSGLWIYQDFWSNFIRLRWRASRQIFLSDLHKAVGISSLFFQLILGFTGAYWNIPSSMQQFRYRNAHPPELTARHWSRAISMDGLLAVCRQELPGFEPTFVGFPVVPGANLQIYGRVGSSFRSDFGSVVIFDAQSGARKGIRDIRNATWREQIIDTFRPLHYGTFGGLFVKILWCVGGLTPGLLALSGFLIWWRRRFGGRPGD
jgi:uncharacterized iron-regulated membrane protein